MARKLFCDLCPLTYELSRWKGIAAPKVSGVLIRPGEVFSFWRLVGATSARKGYREGLMIKRGQPSQGIGGGLCQFTNLLHWLVLHSPLRIVEYHHHDGVDLFPDCGRQIPFGIGTSISYNYLDYRFQNPTGTTFQLLVWTTDIPEQCHCPRVRGQEERQPAVGTMRWCCMRCRKIGLWKRSEGRARAPFSPPSRLAGRKIGGASVLQGDAQTAFRMSSPGKKKPGTMRRRASFICCRLSRERPSFRTLQTSA